MDCPAHTMPSLPCSTATTTTVARTRTRYQTSHCDCSVSLACHKPCRTKRACSTARNHRCCKSTHKTAAATSFRSNYLQSDASSSSYLHTHHNANMTAILLLTLITTSMLVGCSLAQFNREFEQLGAPQYQQHNNILHFEVPEGAPIGTHIGTIRASDGQVPSLLVPSKDTPESERKQALNINMSNGDLTTNAVLDREQRERYHFIAIASEPFLEIKCTVLVKDVNDNAPLFVMQPANETSFVIEVPENQRGIRKTLPLALDLDSPQYGIKEFRIVSGNTPTGTFQLVEHEAPARSSLQNQFLMDDTGAGLLAGDNPQIQQQLSQQATVLIPSQPSMHMLGSTGSVASASFSSASGPQTSRYSIDLEVNQTLDRETQSTYQLVVEAIDGGQPPMLGRLMVTVNVQDANDNDPIFTQKTYESHVKEDIPKGSFITRVQALDADLGANADIKYFIKRHTSSSQRGPASPSNSASDNSNVNSNSNNDMSNSNRYVLNGGTNKQQQQQQQQQQQTQQQPTTRQFSQQTQQTSSTTSAAAAANANKASSTSSSPSQSASNAQQRQQQTASSNEIFDQSANSDFKFRMSSAAHNGNQEQMFEIDSMKGEIYLSHALDYETDQVHDLLIEARDYGKPPRSGYAIVKVYVLDVNDDPPIAAISGNGNGGRNAHSTDENGRRTYAQPASEASRSDPSGRLDAHNTDGFGLDGRSFGAMSIRDINLVNWFAQINSSLLFVIVLVALIVVAFPVCLVKIKSRQPESDYNDTAGLTMAGQNNGQTKPSPNHSTSNEHSHGSSNDIAGAHHRHHDHHARRGGGGGFIGGGGGMSINNSGSFGGLQVTPGNGFGTTSSKMRHQHMDSSNVYHNPYPQHHVQPRHSTSSHTAMHRQHPSPNDSPHHHQMAGGGGGSAGNTMTLHGHHHYQHAHAHNMLAAALSIHDSPGGVASGGVSAAHHHQFMPAMINGGGVGINGAGNGCLPASPLDDVHHAHLNGGGGGNGGGSGGAHHSSSLTYAHHHSRAALLQHAHHHQSLHHLAAAHHHNNNNNNNNSGGHHNNSSSNNNASNSFNSHNRHNVVGDCTIGLSAAVANGCAGSGGVGGGSGFGVNGLITNSVGVDGHQHHQHHGAADNHNAGGQVAGVGNHNKGGTMNSVGTHQSAHPSASPLPATPNTTHSSGLPNTLHEMSTSHHPHSHTHNPLLPMPPMQQAHSTSPMNVNAATGGLHQHQSGQLPPTPTCQHNGSASVFNWPAPQSAPMLASGANSCCNNSCTALHSCNAQTNNALANGCSNNTGGGGGGSNSNTINNSSGNCAPTTTTTPIARSASSMQLDRWFDVGMPSPQLLYAQDWCSSYNWDYLTDWAPEYQTLKPLINDDACDQ